MSLWQTDKPIIVDRLRSQLDQEDREICHDSVIPCLALRLLTPLSGLCDVMYCHNKQHCQTTLRGQRGHFFEELVFARRRLPFVLI